MHAWLVMAVLGIASAAEGEAEDSAGAGLSRQVGPFTWAYVGPVVARDAVTRGSRTYVEVDVQPEPPVERLLGMRMAVEGAEWELVAVDEAALDPEVLARGQAQRDAWVPSLTSPEVVTWTPESWQHEDCNNSSLDGDEVHVYNGESRVEVTSPFTSRQKALVQILAPNGRECSGVLLLSRWVLTAGHCVADDQGLFGDGEDFTINVLSTSSDRDAGGGLFLAPGFQEDDPEVDWALMKLDSAFPSGTWDEMNMWDGSDAAYQDIGAAVHAMGFPGHTLNVSGTCIGNGTEYDDRAAFHGANYQVTQEDSTRLKVRGDTSGGMSGGPHYFCPEGADDECAGGDKGEVIMVHSGFISYPGNRIVGPKVTAFEWIALLIIQAN